MFTTPTVVGDTLYVGSCSGKFYAFEAGTGKVRWSFDTGIDEQAQFHGNPVITSDLVVTPTDSTDAGFTYALDPKTGELLWKTPTDGGGGITTDLLRIDRTAAGITKNGDLVCFGLEDGFVLWSFSPDAYTYRDFWAAAPALAGERIVMGGVDGAVYAIDAETGDRVWKMDLGTRITTAFHVDGDGIYVGLEDDRILRLKLDDGSPVWELPVDGTPAGFALVSDGALVLQLGFGNDAYDVVAIDAADGMKRWRNVSEDPWTTARLFLWNDTVLAGTTTGTLKAFRLRDGTVDWTLSLEGRLRGLGSRDGVLYVGTIDGMLYALGPGEKDDVRTPVPGAESVSGGLR